MYVLKLSHFYISIHSYLYSHYRHILESGLLWRLTCFHTIYTSKHLSCNILSPLLSTFTYVNTTTSIIYGNFKLKMIFVRKKWQESITNTKTPPCWKLSNVMPNPFSKWIVLLFIHIYCLHINISHFLQIYKWFLSSYKHIWCN